MDASLEHVHGEHVHELEPHIRAARARAAVIMFILSDVLGVFAVLAAGGYLRALNTENQFRIAGDHAPTLLPGLLVAIVLVLSGLFYFLWERRVRANDGAGPTAIFGLALLCVVAALGIQIWAALSLGYTMTPFHAYESELMLITWFTWVHFLLLTIIGIVLLGRIFRGRLAGDFGFIAEVTGYWWYYTVLSALLLWVFSLLI